MNYGDLIRDAIQITLRNRYLWFFGFFVGLGSGGGGGGGGGGGDFDEQGSAEIASVSAVQQGPFDNALLIVGLVLVGTRFLSFSNTSILGTWLVVPLVVAAFAGFTLLAGVVDLSIGSMVGFSTAAFAQLLATGWDPLPAGIVTLAHASGRS